SGSFMVCSQADERVSQAGKVVSAWTRLFMLAAMRPGECQTRAGSVVASLPRLSSAAPISERDGLRPICIKISYGSARESPQRELGWSILPMDKGGRHCRQSWQRLPLIRAAGQDKIGG